MWWWANLGLWTMAIFVVAGYCYFHGVSHGVEDGSFIGSLRWAAVDCYGWALFTPVVIWLARRNILSKSAWTGHLLVLILAGAVVVLAKQSVVYGTNRLIEFFQTSTVSFDDYWAIMVRQIPVNGLVYTLIVSVWSLFNYYQRLRDREMIALKLETQLGQAKLDALKMQLHPHFLFNTLNTISAMVHKDSERADRMIVWTSDLLRTVLDNKDDQQVPLAKEIEFLEKYLKIEQIRFGERLQATIECPPSTRQVLVPSLLLQPLVENAIKHGVAKHSGPAAILINSKTVNGNLVLAVEDNGPIAFEEQTVDKVGIGLANTRARLEGLYGDAYQLSFLPQQPKGLKIEIVLPLRPTDEVTR